MAGKYDLLFQQSFSTTDTIVVAHNLDRFTMQVQVIIGGFNRTDLISEVLVSQGNERNELTVVLLSVQSGVIQLLDTDVPSANTLTPEIIAQLQSTGGSQTLEETLDFGNVTGGNHIVLTVGDELRGQSGASLAGAVIVRGGTASSGTAAGGAVSVLGGSPVGAGSAGGAATLAAGDADSVSGPGGAVTINAGDSAGAGNNGGNITLSAGGAASTGNGGNITLTPGVAAGSGANGIVQVNGIRHYGVRTVNPTLPSPTAGDRYYNSTLEMEMMYDATRSKWMSVESNVIQFGRNGNTTAGTFYRGIDSLLTSATTGYRTFFNGTVIAFGYTRSDSDAATFDVTASGTAIFSLASSATSGGSITANADFSQNTILGLQNQAGGNTTSDVAAWVRVKWRA